MNKKLKFVSFLLILGLVLSFMAIPGAMALADWDPGDSYKMHFPQLPDLETGMDAYSSTAGGYCTVADDFMCAESGPITDIHVWGSWYYDILPQGDPVFEICIWSNIPVGPDGHSVPGEMLWSGVFTADNYTARVYAHPVEEPYAIPNPPDPPFIVGYDFTVWQYNFDIDSLYAFYQEEGVTYWLSVLEISNQSAYWGWKTSLDHWQDSSVFAAVPYTPDPSYSYWQLFDPTVAQFDQAFVVTGPPPTTAPPATYVVGGTVVQEDMLVVLLPWAVVAGLLVMGTGAVVFARRRIDR